MRTYNRNVRRAWDGDDYHAPKRQKVQGPRHALLPPTNENVDAEDNLQRAIRETSVAAMSSSPSRKNSTVFSYNEVHEPHEPSTLTPPSSPPPMLEITPPTIKPRKPTFSALDKKKQKEKKRKAEEAERADSEPLSEILNSSRPPNQPAVIQPVEPIQSAQTLQPVQPPRPAQPKVLTQTVLDFGQVNTPVTCSVCQMSYTPSVPEDNKLHDMYHNRHKDGIELEKAFTKSAMKWCYEVPNIQGSVVVVDRKISLPARRAIQRVLEVVNKELGSVEISESDLWGQKTLGEESKDAKKSDCYKVFLHVWDRKVVALLLAERISKAHRVKATNPPEHMKEAANQGPNLQREDSALLTPTSSTAPVRDQFPSSADLELEETMSDAIVGVSRLWTSKAFRKQGIANNLLDCVLTQFIYGLDIDKEEVAFSQPTDMGAALAKSWFGAETGWSVYKEH